jgi:aspartate/methionine/tyrosine aminotransferase
MMTETEFDLLLQIADPEERASRYAAHDPALTKLSVAENVLIYEYLRERVFAKARVLDLEDTKYTTSFGDLALRQGIAALLTRAFGVPVAPGHVFGVSSVSSALECLAFAVLSPGDQVLVPAPCWQGFKWCFEQRPGCELVPFQTVNHQITAADVTAALTLYPRARALVLTNPHNPLGINYAKQNLEEIYALLETRKDLHIISDEMYCLSQTAAARPAFVSAFALDAYKKAPDEQKARVHVVWGLAKDFGLSGFRAGFVVSTSPTVEAALAGESPRKDMAWFSPFDSLKLWIVKQLLSATDNGAPVTTVAIKRYQHLLTQARTATATALNLYKIKWMPQNHAAQFFWLDLRPYLGKPRPECKRSLYPEIDPEEAALECYLRENAGVQLLPGRVLANPSSGWFRLCYTAVATEAVVKAVGRIGEALAQLAAHGDTPDPPSIAQ